MSKTNDPDKSPVVKIIKECVQRALARMLANGLSVCPKAEQIMSEEESYSPIAKSIWKNTQDDREYIICLSSSDYREGEHDDPQDWGYKVPRILAFHSRMTCAPEWDELRFVRVEGTDFYLIIVRFESAPSFSPGGAANLVPSSESFPALTSDRP